MMLKVQLKKQYKNASIPLSSGRILTIASTFGCLNSDEYRGKEKYLDVIGECVEGETPTIDHTVKRVAGKSCCGHSPDGYRLCRIQNHSDKAKLLISKSGVSYGHRVNGQSCKAAPYDVENDDRFQLV